jgi:hypothetical protein
MLIVYTEQERELQIVFSDMMLSHWVSGSRNFEGTYCLHSQESSGSSSWTT